MKKNCWEVKNCGRNIGGEKASELGVCPAAIEKKADGINNGKNGGRCCWAIAGTFCGGRVQGTYASKKINCVNCEFYRLVKDEEGGEFLIVSQINDRLNRPSCE